MSFRVTFVASLVAAAVVAAPMLGLGLSGNGGSHENRSLAAWPGVPRNLAAAKAWPGAVDAWFSDRFAFRPTLVRAYHHGLARLGTSASPQVMLGQEGWLYFLGEDGRQFDLSYRGTQPFTRGELEAASDELERRQAWFAARSARYLVVVVPDKQTIYPEYLPSHIRRVSNHTRLDQLISHLRSHSGVPVLDLRTALLSAKDRDRLYFKSDSHWNLLGAHVGYSEIVAALGQWYPDLSPQPLHRPPWAPNAPRFSGDLAQLIGQHVRYAEEDLLPLGHFQALANGRCARLQPGVSAGLPIAADYQAIVTECNRPGLPRAVVWRDSMSIPLIPLLSEHFSRVVYVNAGHLDASIVDSERPDVVLHVLVERALGSLVHYRMSTPQGPAAAAADPPAGIAVAAADGNR